MKGILYLIYEISSAIGIMYGIIEFADSRRPRSLIGAFIFLFAFVTLMLPELWIINLAVRLPETLGAYLASLLYRPGDVALLAYGALAILPWLLVVPLGRRGKAGRERTFPKRGK
ncbi:MAG: hypothetical protein M1598_06600 [Actinobacteria bacterium]|nr:hypothetical protein [Actinomycetota bacterium]